MAITINTVGSNEKSALHRRRCLIFCLAPVKTLDL